MVRPLLHGSSPYGSSLCGPGPQPQATECPPIDAPSSPWLFAIWLIAVWPGAPAPGHRVPPYDAPSSSARQDLPAFETFDEIVVGEGERKAAISGCPERLTRNHGDFDLLQEQGG